MEEVINSLIPWGSTSAPRDMKLFVTWLLSWTLFLSCQLKSNTELPHMISKRLRTTLCAIRIRSLFNG